MFIRWFESVGAVPQNLGEKVPSPGLSNEAYEREEMVDPDVVRTILDYAVTYKYAST